MTRQPLPREAARPFDYAKPTPDDMCAAIGGWNWVIAKRTPQIVERYGSNVICLSQAKYASAEARAIEARGWARPCELVIRDLVDNIKDYPEAIASVIRDAEALLVEARNP